MRMETIEETATQALCPNCQNYAVDLIIHQHGGKSIPWCDACIETGEAKLDWEPNSGNYAYQWDGMCPKIYRKTDLNHPDLKINRDSIDEVLKWRNNPKGLLLGGPSGRGKTRCTWMLLKLLHFKYHERILPVTETQFAHDLGSAFGSGASEGREYIKKLCQVKILFIDDLGKSVNTNRFSQELYHVIEQRTSWELPIIASINATGQEYEERLGDIGLPILRRLREFCHPIKFV